MAKRELLDMKFPIASDQAKWMTDSSNRYNIPVSDFAEFVQIALTEAVQELTDSFKTFKKKKRELGFCPPKK